MNPILDNVEVPYDKMEWVWISHHYDIHLDGLCRHNGALSRFETWDLDSERPFCKVFRLSLFEKLSWLLSKRLFELFVGRHWTYPDRKNGEQFQMGGWMGRAMFTIYYACKRRK